VQAYGIVACLDLPPRPPATLALHGDERPQLLFHTGVASEANLNSVIGVGALEPGTCAERTPAPALLRKLVTRQRARHHRRQASTSLWLGHLVLLSLGVAE
jgi:hypothetical protein